MSESNPIRIFVTHLFSEHPDYQRVFEYLESANNFFYINCSDPEAIPPSGGQEALKETLLTQIRNSEVVIVIGTMYSENRDLIAYQLDAAEASNIPLVGLEAFGGLGNVPEDVAARCAEMVGWNDRLMVDAIRREARHEETQRWEVVEFDLS